MQSCSIHHCVLFFLTLTFTTAPVSAAVCPTLAKLHQSVTLPCEYECSGMAKWTLDENRDVVFARCNKTSCSSLKEGYEMSHAQYLKGDLSLTITAADYSKRNTYTCECGIREISTVSLSIETVVSAVQMNPGEHLILDLSVPEPVEVIYKSRDSADGEQICTVTQRSLQCKAEYTHRTSLSYPELTLRDVGWSDSGSYTIRDLKNNEDIRVYAVSVTGLTKGGIAAVVLVVLLPVVVGLLIAGVIIYRRKAAQERRGLKSRMEEVNKLIMEFQSKNTGPEDQNSPNPKQISRALEKVKKVKKAINDLEQQYTENSEYSDYVGLFCNQKRAELIFWKNFYEAKLKGSQKSEAGKVMEMKEEVVTIIEYLKCESYKKKCSTSYVLLMCMCIHMESCLQHIETWCNKRKELNKPKQQPSGGEEVSTMMDDMETLLDVFKKWCEEKMKELEKYREKIISAGSSKENPTAVENSEGGELTPLNRVQSTQHDTEA